jgi:hypothetical protein
MVLFTVNSYELLEVTATEFVDGIASMLWRILRKIPGLF